MHKLVTLAAVVVLAASSANCSRDNSSEGASATVTGPSATEARGGKGVAVPVAVAGPVAVAASHS